MLEDIYSRVAQAEERGHDFQMFSHEVAWIVGGSLLTGRSIRQDDVERQIRYLSDFYRLESIIPSSIVAERDVAVCPECGSGVGVNDGCRSCCEESSHYINKSNWTTTRDRRIRIALYRINARRAFIDNDVWEKLADCPDPGSIRAWLKKIGKPRLYDEIPYISAKLFGYQYDSMTPDEEGVILRFATFLTAEWDALVDRESSVSLNLNFAIRKAIQHCMPDGVKKDALMSAAWVSPARLRAMDAVMVKIFDKNGLAWRPLVAPSEGAKTKRGNLTRRPRASAPVTGKAKPQRVALRRKTDIPVSCDVQS